MDLTVGMFVRIIKVQIGVITFSVYDVDLLKQCQFICYIEIVRTDVVAGYGILCFPVLNTKIQIRGNDTDHKNCNAYYKPEKILV